MVCGGRSPPYKSGLIFGFVLKLAQILNKVDDDGSVTMNYTAEAFQQEDNFSRVNVSPTQIEVKTFGGKGQLLDTTILPL